MVKKIAYLIIIVSLIGGGFGAYFYFTKIAKKTANSDVQFIYIRSNDSYELVLKKLEQKGVIEDTEDLKWIANKMNYPNKVLSGKYRIEPQITFRELITKLRSGIQETVKLTFNNIRTQEDLAGNISSQIEIDSITILNHLKKKPETFLHFIPNTYEVYWNLSEKSLFAKMKNEYNRFWNSSRRSKAKQIGLTPKEVAILASITQSETIKNDEKPRVAGVYANRLKKRMLLQADPTLVFAHQDFGIKRVLNFHKEIDSPYNTYKYIGLPPGPICLPEISSLDAVLNYENHDYIFFCAREDFSGYHNFAKTNKQHERNAKLYRDALDKRKIYR